MCFCSYTTFSSHSVLPQRKKLLTTSSSFFHFSHLFSSYDSYSCCSKLIFPIHFRGPLSSIGSLTASAPVIAFPYLALFSV
jgi:hypothetical protein